MERVTVHTQREYDILINNNILKDAGKLISNISEAASGKKICLISDNTVFDIFGDTVIKSLESSGFDVYKIIFPPGENTKSFYCYEKILEYLAYNDFSRTDLLLALGGGVIGDLTGFAAATYLRGIDFVQVPTTLLSAVDASVGGKTAINLKSGKNLAGAFHQPILVLFDSDTLITLPNDMYKDGMSEIIKSGMISDKKLFDSIAKSDNQSRQFILKCVISAIKVKRALVEADEKEQGLRKLLNFGHTMAHAIEICSEYSISHGHSVAIGMVTCAKAAEKLRMVNKPSSEILEKVLRGYGIDTSCPYNAYELAKVALKDKKRKGNLITLIIPLEIGECAAIDMEIDKLEEFFELGLS